MKNELIWERILLMEELSDVIDPEEAKEPQIIEFSEEKAEELGISPFETRIRLVEGISLINHGWRVVKDSGSITTSTTWLKAGDPLSGAEIKEVVNINGGQLIRLGN